MLPFEERSGHLDASVYLTTLHQPDKVHKKKLYYHKYKTVTISHNVIDYGVLTEKTTSVNVQLFELKNQKLLKATKISN
jgi:hypothetical protein